MKSSKTMPNDAVPGKPWSLPVSLFAIAAGMPAMFWLRFGYVDGYAFGFTGFLLLLVLAVHFIPRKAEETAARGEGARIQGGRFDFLGVVWLLSIPFAPFVGWAVSSAGDLNADNWRALLSIRAGLCVVLPLVCVLPLLRYVPGGPVAFKGTVLLLGTLFPVLTGFGAAQDVLRGPKWEEIRIERLEDIRFRTGAGTRVEVPDAFVHLADGRRLTHPKGMTLRVGPATAASTP